MLNVSWAKKRAKFVFVFAVRERASERKGESEEAEHDRQRYKTMKIRNDGVR